MTAIDLNLQVRAERAAASGTGATPFRNVRQDVAHAAPSPLGALPAPVAGVRSAAGRGSASLAVEGLTQAYGPIVALDNVSMAAAAGEVVSVLGYSGSGKSTLLRLIAGLERPQSGTVALDNVTVAGAGTFVPPERRGVGMMFQDYALFPHLSLIRNVAFGLRGRPSAEAKARALAALERVGLAHRAHDYPHTLSGGEQQRVALARALAPSPHVLLMDEPFSNLDRQTREMVRRETASVLRESGATAIIVTHDQDDATFLADRIVLMQAGQVAQDGTPEDLFRRPASLAVARFFATFNEIAGTARGGTVETPIGRFSAADVPDGGAVTVCIREADVEIGVAGGTPATGRVTARRFAGDGWSLDIAVAGLPLPLRVHAPLRTAVTVGDKVGLAVSPEAALVFG